MLVHKNKQAQTLNLCGWGLRDW